MINETTIINGKKIGLSETEQLGVSEFHRSRLAFAVIFNDENDYTLAINKNDPREHRVYLKEDFNITDEKFENLIRGYIKPGKINFYISSYFKSIDKHILTEELLKEILNIALNTYGPGEYVIGNGLIVGTPGKEEWPPLEIIGTYLIEEKNISKTLIK